MPGIDLHVHSNASDGEHPPAEVVGRAQAAGLGVIALTDHDTLAGVPAAVAAGAAPGVRVIAGCEFSVQAPWGELHLLAYFLPADAPTLERFLADQRAKRERRAGTIVQKLHAAGVTVSLDEVLAEANGGAVGRPHVARALVAKGAVADVPAAFDRYLGTGRPAYVPKELPTVAAVTALVRRLGGVTSAAHLGPRATRRGLERLKREGVDGVEARHPAHDDVVRRRIEQLAATLGLLPTGGTDWHGTRSATEPDRAPLGTITVPETWLAALEGLHAERGAKSDARR